MDFFTINLLNGLAFGSVIFLIAAGFTLILGVMGILQLAHTALYMVGAYVGWTVAVQLGLNWGLALLVAGVACGLIGVVMERGFLCHLHRMIDEQVVLTFGFIYMLTNLTQWIWGEVPRVPFTAPLLSGSFDIADMSYPVSRVFLIIVGLIVGGGLWWWQANTRLGAMVRAGMDNKEMAMGIGVNVGLVSTIVFLIGSVIAGIAGVLGAQLLGAHLLLAGDTLRFAVAVTIVGGLGSIPGAVVGAILIGVIDSFGRILFPEYAIYTIYVVILVMLILRPSGILGTGRKGL